MLESSEFIYRLQGWFEIEEADSLLNKKQLIEVQKWVGGVQNSKKTNIVHYIESMLEAIKLGGCLINISRLIAAYLDKNFEHHMLDEKYKELVLQPAALASKSVKLKNVPELSDVSLAYRMQGYVELSKNKHVNLKQLNMIQKWCDKTPKKQTAINSFCYELSNHKNDKYYVYDFLQHYFKNYIDPSYAANPNELYDIHFGIANTLKPL